MSNGIGDRDEGQVLLRPLGFGHGTFVEDGREGRGQASLAAKEELEGKGIGDGGDDGGVRHDQE